MRRKTLALFILILIALTGCNIAKDKSYYSQFKNPSLNYEWDFNPSLSIEGHEPGGHTFNSTYFQIKKYNLFDEFRLKIPYEVQYKHEEGHIFTLQLLDIEDLDEYESNKFKILNLSDHHSYRQYIISVSEGIADHYAINYFNNSKSHKYYSYIKSKKDKVSQFKQHHQGISYIDYALNNNTYSNFSELVLDLGSREQYSSYAIFLENLEKK